MVVELKGYISIKPILLRELNEILILGLITINTLRRVSTKFALVSISHARDKFLRVLLYEMMDRICRDPGSCRCVEA